MDVYRIYVFMKGEQAYIFIGCFRICIINKI